MAETTHLTLPFLEAAQAHKHVTVNESLLRLDALVQLAARSRSTAAQPASPDEGDVYILPSGKSGAAWSAMANGALAYWRDGVWEEIAPKTGWRAFVEDSAEHVVYAAGAWALAPATKSVTLSASDKILGRVSAGAGAAEEVTFTDQAQQLCDDSSFSAMRATLGAAGLADANVFTAAQVINANAAAAPALPSGGAMLHAIAADGATARFLFDAFGQGATFISRRANNTNASPAALAAGNAIGGLNGHGYDGSAYQTGKVAVEFRAAENWTTGAQGSRIGFRTTLSGATTTADRLVIENDGQLLPGADNAQNIGSGALRFATVYAGTGAINTSDAREKTALGPLPPGLIRAVRRVLGAVGAYQWLSAVDAKGAEGARLHIGVTAQAVRDAFIAEGEDPERWALFCRDVVDGGERLSLRADQLIWLALAALSA